MNISQLKHSMQDSIQKAEIKIYQFENQYSLQEIKKKKAFYMRISRNKQGIVIPHQEMKILRQANTLHYKYTELQRGLNILNQNLIDLLLEMEDGCCNCKRKNSYDPNSVSSPYILTYTKHQVKQLIKRRGSLVFLDISSTSEDVVILCDQCSEYFTNPEKEVSLFENTWPSFLWSILSDKEILDTYSNFIWRFVPLKWRPWWIDAVHECEGLSDVTIDNPSPIFKDISDDINHMKDGLKLNTLTDLERVTNQHLMPTVLCPWGE